jgi:serine/threonine protein kinase
MTAVSSQPVRGSRFPTLEKYDVLEELGHGGMATVYRARDLRLGRDVAVKVIHPHLRDSAEAVRRFAIEARAVAKLRHANIVEVYDVSSASESEQYLVVELLRGVTLRRLLEQHGALPAEVAASICVELLGAIAHAHDAGVIHRDVKPENVIIEHRQGATRLGAKDETVGAPSQADSSPGVSATVPIPRSGDSPGDRMTIKLTDFGIAKLLDAQGVTSTGQVLGSPAHMAPEQIEGREVDGRADVFGVGVLLYECLVGHLPFQGTNPAQVLRRVLEGEYPSAEREAPTVGHTWSRLVDKALASNLDDRFSGAPTMRDALVAELARLGVSSTRREIEAWLDDPAGFRSAHDLDMTARLCRTGDSASRRGDVLTAASDYNRALAYAPHDAALLKVVARLNRRSARQNIARRAWPYALATLLVAGLSFGARRPITELLRAHPVTVDSTMAIPAVSPESPSIAPVSIPLPPDLATPPRTLAHPAVGVRIPTPPKATVREIRFTAVEPPQGVRVSLDGATAIALDATKPLVLDDKVHSLVFSCSSDVCDTLTRPVEAGDRAIAIAVKLTVKPSRLRIRGSAANTYVLAEDPSHHLQVDEFPNEIAMQHFASRVVHVTEIETGRTQSVELRAGKVSKLVDFVAPP